MESLLASFHQNRCPATFVGHLEFLGKTEKHVYLETERARAIFRQNF